jgi:hypothetical protein
MNPALGAGVAAVVVLAVAIVFVLVSGDDGGGGGGGTAADDSGTTTAPEASSELSREDLGATLLTLDDFASSWSPQPDPGLPEPPDYQDDPACDPMFEILDEDLSSLEARYENGTEFAVHYVDLIDGDMAGVAALEEAMTDCPEYTYTYGNPTETAEVSQDILESAQIGDASLAYSRQFRFITADGSETYGVAFRVAWEHDGVLSTILYVDSAADGDEPADYLQTEAEDLATLADDRLQGVLDG